MQRFIGFYFQHHDFCTLRKLKFLGSILEENAQFLPLLLDKKLSAAAMALYPMTYHASGPLYKGVSRDYGKCDIKITKSYEYD